MRTTPRLAPATLIIALAACSDAPTSTGLSRPAPRPQTVGQLVTTVTITDLGTLGTDGHGDNYSRANAVNDSGVVVGVTTTAGEFWKKAFRWRQATGMVAMNINGEAMDINLGGQMVGFGFSANKPWRREADGTYALLGSLPCCGDEGASYGDNSAGYVVGTLDNGTVKHAVVWNPTTQTLSDLGGGIPGYGLSEARAINSSNMIVGTDYGSEATPYARAWRRQLGGGNQVDLDVMGTWRTYAYDINDNGVIVGKVHIAGTYPEEFHAVRWVNDVAEDLGTLGEPSEARSISKSGYIAGFTGSGTGTRAVVWRPNGARIQLPGLAATSATEAHGISNKKLWVAGTSTIGGTTHAVLWKVKNTHVVLSDVMPGSFENILHLGAGGFVSVAILAGDGDDVRQIDPSVLTLGDERGTDTPIARNRDGSPMVSYEDVDKDGDLDLVAYYDQSHLERNRDLTSATTQLVLSGDLGDDSYIRGTDRVTVR